MKRNSKAVRLAEAGFTLVELMIVVAIIGILAAIAIPNFQKYQAKTRQKEAQILLSNLYTAEISNRGEHGTFTACLSNAGFAPEGARRYYAVGFTEGVAGAANCRVPGTTADIACNLAVTAGVGEPTSTDTCTDSTGTNRAAGAVAFNADTTQMTHAYPATIYAGEAGVVANLGTSSFPATNAVSTTAFQAAAVGSVASNLLIDTWIINEGKVLSNTISGI